MTTYDELIEARVWPEIMKELESLKPGDLVRADVGELVQRLVAHKLCAPIEVQPSLASIERYDASDPAQGWEFAIPVGPNRDISALLGIQESGSESMPPLSLRDGAIRFRFATGVDVQQTALRVTANLERINAGVERGNTKLRGRAERVVGDARDNALRLMEEAREQEGRFREMGFNVPGLPQPVEPVGLPSEEAVGTADVATGASISIEALRVVRSDADLAEASRIIDELDATLHTAEDSGDLNEAGLALVQDALRPLLSDLKDALRIVAGSPEERLRAADVAAGKIHRVRQGLEDLYTVLKPPIGVAKDMAWLVSVVPTAAGWAATIAGFIDHPVFL